MFNREQCRTKRSVHRDTDANSSNNLTNSKNLTISAYNKRNLCECRRGGWQKNVGRFVVLNVPTAMEIADSQENRMQ